MYFFTYLSKTKEMKNIFMIFMLFVSINVFGQDFTYKIKVTNVINIESAKVVSENLRNLFRVLPTFSDSVDIFTINTNLNFDKNYIVSYLNQYGYDIDSFSKKMREQIYYKEEDKD